MEASIGAEVRRLRKSLDLTVAELGLAAGISAGMLSKIENGAISPSLSTLNALAQALNVPISSLFAETEERRDCSFVKAGRGVRIERRGTKAGHLYDLLGHSLRGEIAVEPYLITLAEDAARALGIVVWPMVEYEADDALATAATDSDDCPSYWDQDRLAKH